MMWKKLYPPLILIFLLSVCSVLAQERKVKKIFTIGVTQYNASEVSEKDQKGFEKALADAGFKEKVHVIYDRQNAEENLTKAHAIALKFLSKKLDLIHTIGSPTSRAIVKLIEEIPVVFSSVNHPVEAGLVPKTSLPGTKSGTNVTGVSHRWPVSRQFERYSQFLPKAKKWGTIYHQGDSHTLALIKEVRGTAKRLGMELVEAVISNSEETLQAASFLAGKVQAFYITYDETVLSSIDAVVKVCNEQKVPLFTSDLESVAKGAIAAYGLNFYLIGYSAGKKAARILKGEEPGNIPWGRVERLHLVLNEQAAKAQGVILSPELLKRSDKIIPQ